MKKETVLMPCLYCDTQIEIEVGSYQHEGIFNVFCPDEDKHCEDKYAQTL